MKSILANNGQWITYYGVNEAANLLYISPLEVEREMWAGHIPFAPIDGENMISEQDIQGYLYMPGRRITPR